MKYVGMAKAIYEMLQYRSISLESYVQGKTYQASGAQS